MAASGISTTWTNADGLLVRFGTTESAPGTTGSYEDAVGGNQVMEARVFFGTDVPTGGYTPGTSATGVNAMLDPNGGIFIPPTAIIERMEIFVVKALVAGTSVSMGLMKSDYATRVGSDDVGLLNAETQSNLGTTGRRWLYTISGGFLDGAPGTTSAHNGTALGSPPGGVTTPLNAIPTLYTSGTFTSGELSISIFLRYASRDAILT